MRRRRRIQCKLKDKRGGGQLAPSVPNSVRRKAGPFKFNLKPKLGNKNRKDVQEEL